MRILFVCKDHGARSRLAEALAKRTFASEHEVASAGLFAGSLTPLAAQVLKDVGDTKPAPARTLSAVDLKAFDLAVVVGMERDVTDALPSTLKHITWPLMEPSDPPAAPGEIKARFAELRIALDKHLKTLSKIRRTA